MQTEAELLNMKLAPDLLWFVHLQLLGGSPVSTWDMFFSPPVELLKTWLHRVSDTGVRIVATANFKEQNSFAPLARPALPVPLFADYTF